MSGPAPTAQPKERVFGNNGETLEEIPAEQEEVPAEEPAAEEPEPEVEEPEAETPAAAKYRIGDKLFATQAEALAYAESQVAASAENDAIRQLLRETISARAPAESVTQTSRPADNAEELYTNPDEYLRKRDERIKSEVLQQVQASQASVDADNRIWSEFVERHPDLSEFRNEITLLVKHIQPEVQAVGRNKGQASAIDYVATKFKAQVERAAAALKPKRELALKGGGAPAGGIKQSVTPKTPPAKALSFTEQLRQTRKGRR